MHTVRILVVPHGGVGVRIGLTKLGGVDILARKLPVANFVPDILWREDLRLGLIRWPFLADYPFLLYPQYQQLRVIPKPLVTEVCSHGLAAISYRQGLVRCWNPFSLDLRRLITFVLGARALPHD